MKLGGEMRIVLIDDNANVEEELRGGLVKIGVDPRIDYYCPTKRNEPFGGAELPQGTGWDEVDLVLVDLELFPLVESVQYDAADLRGGTEVLPYVRQAAPWIPVVAYSKLFQREAAYFTTIACGFGFDGHTTRGMFTAKWLTQDFWRGLVERARLLRRTALVGEAYAGEELQGNVDLANPARAELATSMPRWERLVRELFCFGETATLEALPGAWSGARVFRSYVTLSSRDGGGEGEWLLKLSNSPARLHDEVCAHLRMMRRGVEFARSVALLWQGVMVVEHEAGIAYQFAKGTRPAVALCGIQSTAELVLNIASVLKGFYPANGHVRGVVGQIVRPWCPRRERLEESAKLLEGTSTGTLVGTLLREADDGLLAKTVRYRRGLIHGDLHLGNIMLGENGVLVDFARAGVGPVAADMAELVADVLFRIPEMRGIELPSWLEPKEPWLGVSEPLRVMAGFNEDDALIFDLLLRVHLAAGLIHDWVESDAKAWIRNVLGVR